MSHQACCYTAREVKASHTSTLSRHVCFCSDKKWDFFNIDNRPIFLFFLFLSFCVSELFTNCQKWSRRSSCACVLVIFRVSAAHCRKRADERSADIGWCLEILRPVVVPSIRHHHCMLQHYIASWPHVARICIQFLVPKQSQLLELKNRHYPPIFFKLLATLH